MLYAEYPSWPGTSPQKLTLGEAESKVLSKVVPENIQTDIYIHRNGFSRSHSLRIWARKRGLFRHQVLMVEEFSRVVTAQSASHRTNMLAASIRNKATFGIST